ncbi:MAG: tat (twin-arginine translocation) pathway signal sequence, partial [bacterium]|nr:tat (twin-arginine translocation) pathway signal sequence [bacterium]
RKGSATLDAAAGGSFHSASAAKRLAAVKHIEGSPFFSKVRATCIASLYNNQMAFAHFGYQGASWQHGGYIRRGFNDLTWLPNPPSSASPAAWLR